AAGGRTRPGRPGRGARPGRGDRPERGGRRRAEGVPDVRAEGAAEQAPATEAAAPATETAGQEA
ncbi:MAG TPA: 30S ribosomal protein S3, partial [Microlunatus sp.]|nr:30S ribosomal protein S3 [Microlunatus sp.]